MRLQWTVDESTKVRGVHLRSCVKSLLDFSFSLFLKDTAFRCCVTVVDHVYSSHFFSGSSLIRFPVVTHLVGKKYIYFMSVKLCCLWHFHRFTFKWPHFAFQTFLDIFQIIEIIIFFIWSENNVELNCLIRKCFLLLSFTIVKIMSFEF